MVVEPCSFLHRKSDRLPCSLLFIPQFYSLLTPEKSWFQFPVSRNINYPFPIPFINSKQNYIFPATTLVVLPPISSRKENISGFDIKLPYSSFKSFPLLHFRYRILFGSEQQIFFEGVSILGYIVRAVSSDIFLGLFYPSDGVVIRLLAPLRQSYKTS